MTRRSASSPGVTSSARRFFLLLPERRRPHKRARDPWPLHHPRQRQLRDRDPGLGREALHRLGEREVLRVQLGGKARLRPRARVLGRLGPGAVLAGQDAAGQRIVRQHAHPLVAAQWDQFGLDPPVGRRVRRLDGSVPCEPAAVACPQRFTQLPGGVVRTADVADLPGPDQVIERPQRLLERRHRIEPMDLVEIDVVGLETPEAPLNLLHDVPARAVRIVRAVAGLLPALGRNDRLVPPAPQRAAHDRFGQRGHRRGRRGAIRGVNQVHAVVQRVVDHRRGGRLVRTPPNAFVPSPNTDTRSPELPS